MINVLTKRHCISLYAMTYVLRCLFVRSFICLSQSDRVYKSRILGFNIVPPWITKICDNFHHIGLAVLEVWKKWLSSSDGRSFYCQPSSVASYHGSVMSIVMILCRRSYCKVSHIVEEQWMVVVADEDIVNHGRTTSRNGQGRRCRHSSLLCIADWHVMSMGS